MDAVDVERSPLGSGAGSDEIVGETCWFCDRCSEEELFISEDEFPGYEAKVLSYLGGDPPECLRTESDCDDLLQCSGSGGSSDAKEEDTELLEAMELAGLLSAGRWSDAERLIQSRPAIVDVVQDRRLLMVRGPQCIGGVYALFALPSKQLERLGAVQ